ncbi:MAG: hypothetical protein WCO63_12835 [Bacteroidota bacterium]
MTESNELIDSIQQKVKALISQCSTVQKEHKKMQDLINKKEAIIIEQKQNIKQLEDKITILKITKSLEKGKENSDARRRINEMIKEIDKCIGLINS